MENSCLHYKYRGLPLELVAFQFKTDYEPHMRLCVRDSVSYYQEIFMENTIRLLVIDGIVIDTTVG
jgi:hypothetical protein